MLFPCCWAGRAATSTWTGGGDGQNWFDAANWDAGVPGAGDDAVISAGNVMLTNSTADLRSLSVAGTGSLVFSNWNTSLTASNVTIGSGGAISHVVQGVTETNALGEWPKDARVWVVCTNFILEAGGSVNAADRGYVGGSLGDEAGKGPGGGPFSDLRWGAGASHGNKGGAGYRVAPCVRYGFTNAPVEPGSGGGGQTTGRGGGAVLIQASGLVSINDTISATGGNGAGGGSGGSIQIQCRTFDGGTNGCLDASGGDSTSRYGGGAAGGRISVVYDTGAQALLSVPDVRFKVSGGAGDPDDHGKPGGNGTLYFPDYALFHSDLKTFVDTRIYGVTNLSVGAMCVTNRVVAFSERNFFLQVTNSITLDGVEFEMGSDLSYTDRVEIDCESLTLTNGASLTIYSGPTNGVHINSGAEVSVSADMRIASNCWVYPYSNNTNGGSVHFTARSVFIAQGGGFNADGLGYDDGGADGINGYGPGGGEAVGLRGGGGGYGGEGGRGANGGPVNGHANAPDMPGSGGGAAGGRAGGLVRLNAAADIYLEGIITANGMNGGRYAGSGSGGGIFLIAQQDFEATTNASLHASGGNSGDQGGAGGGGRIAIWDGVWPHYQDIIFADPDNATNNIPRLIVTTNFAGAYAVTNGFDENLNDADPGTFVSLNIPKPSGTVILTY